MPIEVKHEPRKEVIIHEISLYKTPEELVRNAFGGAPAGSILPTLKWVNRVLLTFTPLPMSEIITKEIIDGRLHGDHVSLAPMDKFEPTITVADKNMVINVIDVSANETFSAIGRYLFNEILPKPEQKAK